MYSLNEHTLFEILCKPNTLILIMSDLDMPNTPVELASIVAEESISQSFEISDQEVHQLASLEYGAEELGFLRRNYFVEAHRGVILPADCVSGERLTFINLMGVTLEGRFLTYSKVHIGRLAGGNAVRAVCMAFESATLLPFFDTVPDDQLVHVPVLSVAAIEPT